MNNTAYLKRPNPRIFLLCCFFLIFQFVLVSHVSAFTSELTGDELIGYLQDSRSIENPLKRSLARRISKELAEAGLSFADMGFSVGDSIPRVDTGRYKIYGGSWSANLDGNKTSISMRSVPGQVGFDVNLGGTFSLSASGAARPFGFIRVGWRHVDISGNGNFQLKLSLVLDSSFVGDGENAYAILGQQISMTGSNPLSGDMHLSMDIDVGTTSDILTGAIVEEFLEAKVKPTIIKMMKESLQAGLAVKNNELRARLPVYYRIPSLHESIAQIADDSRRTELQGRIQELLKKPLIGNIVEQRFQELAFYVLTDNRDALMKMACDFTQSLHAGMAQPKLYTDALGSCGIADLTGNRRLSEKFFTDASCTTEVPFKRTTYASYCSELLDGTIPDELLLTLTTESTFQRRPNTQLGNAAAWTPDSGQPNNPLPSVPSQAWSLAHGTQFAITTESLTGKTIPFVKRIRYRETPKKISNRVPIYRGCLVAGDGDNAGSCLAWGYANYDFLSAAFKRDLAGYVNSASESGNVAMHYGCTEVYQGSEGDYRCMNWGIRKYDELSTGFRRDFVGYVSPSLQPDMFAVYENCTEVNGGSDSGYQCLSWEAGEKRESPDTYFYPSRFVGNLYKSDQTACQLEMRVYKKNIDAKNLKPLLAFHGGSWNSRGAAFIGFESQLAHYTEQGFIVFAPFYRLSGEVDGNPECNGASWNDVVADAEAAHDWVKRNAIKFGADPIFPVVMGQSAGAHLAGWLMTYRPKEVSGGLLLYPPADLKDLLVKYRSGYFSGTAVDIERTMDILSGFIGTNARLLPVDDKLVVKNSFAEHISNLGTDAPPAFLLHGLADDLVPVSQSIAMCNAYGGATNERSDEFRSIYGCGTSGSQLHLVQQGEHGLDSCLTDLSGPCLAGDLSSRDLVADSLRQAREWLWQHRVEYGSDLLEKDNTTLQLSSSANPVSAGEDYTLIAKVLGNNPSGTVTFSDGSNILGIATLTSGQAILTASLHAIGLHTITAKYDGDAKNKASISSIQIHVTRTSDEDITLIAHPNPAMVGNSVVLTAVIASDTTASGTITFSDDIGLLGSVVVEDNKATFTTFFSTAGSKKLIASYSGDENHPSSTVKLTITVQAPWEEQVLPVLLQLLLSD